VIALVAFRPTRLSARSVRRVIQLADTGPWDFRSSVGAGLIWDSPFGPLRFDYAIALTKQSYDVVQQFRFGGGTKF